MMEGEGIRAFEKLFVIYDADFAMYRTCRPAWHSEAWSKIRDEAKEFKTREDAQAFLDAMTDARQ
jgi:hypothetical protein